MIRLETAKRADTGGESTSLSTGSAFGIAVGVVVLILIALWLIMRRQRETVKSLRAIFSRPSRGNRGRPDRYGRCGGGGPLLPLGSPDEPQTYPSSLISHRQFDLQPHLAVPQPVAQGATSGPCLLAGNPPTTGSRLGAPRDWPKTNGGVTSETYDNGKRRDSSDGRQRHERRKRKYHVDLKLKVRDEGTSSDTESKSEISSTQTGKRQRTGHENRGLHRGAAGATVGGIPPNQDGNSPWRIYGSSSRAVEPPHSGHYVVTSQYGSPSLSRHGRRLRLE